MEKVRAHIFVSGLVQGVWFRASTVDRADRIGGLTGWARNESDGRVEVLCEGSKEKVDELIEWLWQGPPSARVTGVDVSWGEAEGEFSGFSVRY